MSGTDLATIDAPRETVRLTTEQLQYISGTESIPKPIRGNLPAILAIVATGREVGIGDMTALRQINYIDGRTAFSAELMVMLVRRGGHSIVGNFAEDAVTITGRRADNGDSMSVTWTMAMATRAGLANKSNWKHYPEAMLWARAVSQLCRMLYADCFAGGTYTAEELGDDGYKDSSAEGAESHAGRVLTGGGADAQAPGTEAPIPEPTLVDDGRFPPPDDAPLEPVKIIVDAVESATYEGEQTDLGFAAMAAQAQERRQDRETGQ